MGKQHFHLLSSFIMASSFSTRFKRCSSKEEDSPLGGGDVFTTWRGLTWLIKTWHCRQCACLWTHPEWNTWPHWMTDNSSPSAGGTQLVRGPGQAELTRRGLQQNAQWACSSNLIRVTVWAWSGFSDKWQDWEHSRQGHCCRPDITTFCFLSSCDAISRKNWRATKFVCARGEIWRHIFSERIELSSRRRHMNVKTFSWPSQNFFAVVHVVKAPSLSAPRQPVF